MLFMPDLLHFWLTGIKANEYTIASTSQMLNPAERTWNASLLSKFGIATDLFPAIVPTRHQTGCDLACRCGPYRGLPPTRQCSLRVLTIRLRPFLAVPAEGADWAYLSSGTWSLMGLELPEPLVDSRVAKLNFTNEGGVGRTIRFLKNIAGLWLVQECRGE